MKGQRSFIAEHRSLLGLIKGAQKYVEPLPELRHKIGSWLRGGLATAKKGLDVLAPVHNWCCRRTASLETFDVDTCIETAQELREMMALMKSDHIFLLAASTGAVADTMYDLKQLRHDFDVPFATVYSYLAEAECCSRQTEFGQAKKLAKHAVKSTLRLLDDVDGQADREAAYHYVMAKVCSQNSNPFSC